MSDSPYIIIDNQALPVYVANFSSGNIRDKIVPSYFDDVIQYYGSYLAHGGKKSPAGREMMSNLFYHSHN